VKSYQEPSFTLNDHEVLPSQQASDPETTIKCIPALTLTSKFNISDLPPYQISSVEPTINSPSRYTEPPLPKSVGISNSNLASSQVGKITMYL
jgi:hypothetical protein